MDLHHGGGRAPLQHVADLQEHRMQEHLVAGAVDQMDRARDVGGERDRIERLVRATSGTRMDG